MAKPQSIGQSKCSVCEKKAGVGSGLVLAFGSGGRVHALGCLAIAQNRLALNDRRPDHLRGPPYRT